MRRRNSERAHCYALMEWCNLHPICKNLIFHIENERQCSPPQGWARKRMGIRSGVFDYFLPYPTAQFKGLWVEMKIKPNQPTNEQISWQQSMLSLGFEAKIAWSVDEAIKIIEDYLKT